MSLPRAVFLTFAMSRIASGQTYTISTIAGGGLPVNIPATAASFVPALVAVDKAGNIFLGDFFEHVVLRLDASTGVLTLVAGNGSARFSGDNGPAVNAQLNRPWNIALDSAGNLYIADSANTRIHKVSSGIISTVAGDGASLGDGGPATNAQLSAPQSIAVDSLGNLYIGEYNRVRMLSNGVISTVAGNGNPGFGGDNGPATSAQLSNLNGAVALDAQGNRLFAVSSGQVTFQVPWELAGQSRTSLSATANGQTSAAQAVTLAPFAPGIFSTNGQGTGQGAILDTSFSPSNPANAGSTILQIYCTGLGAVTNQPPSGSPPAGQLSQTTAPTVTIGGVQSRVLFSGVAPASVGQYQEDALVPAGSSKGAAGPVVIAIGGAKSNTVTLAVQ